MTDTTNNELLIRDFFDMARVLMPASIPEIDHITARLAQQPAVPEPKADPVVRFNDDGSLDEVVGIGQFHLEQMAPCHWWMQFGPHMVNLHSRGKITAHFGENEARATDATTAEPITLDQNDIWTCPLPEHWLAAIVELYGSEAEDLTMLEQRARELAKEPKP